MVSELVHTASSASTARRERHWGGTVVGGFFLSMGGVHIGLVAADTEVYRHFADAGLFAFVRDGWRDVFMAQPALFGLLVAAGEITLGALLLRGGRAADIGWVGVITFHLLLMLFGFGFWLWCLPALALLIYLARRSHPPGHPSLSPPERHTAVAAGSSGVGDSARSLHTGSDWSGSSPASVTANVDATSRPATATAACQRNDHPALRQQAAATEASTPTTDTPTRVQ